MNKILGLVLVIVTVVGAIYLTRDKTDQTTDTAETLIPSEPNIAKTPRTSPAQKINESKASPNVEDQQQTYQNELDYLKEYDSISELYKSSLLDMTKRVFRYAKRDVKSQDLINEFEQKELSPEIRIDSNPYTGTLNIVRTRSVLPGTRYFHAQFFENDDGSEFIQHISFEFKASEHSFAAVEKTILQQFLTEDVEQTQNKENFKSWRRDDGYVIWMKRLEKADIKTNPYNVYTEEDIGTIRVAIELDIHDHSPAFHAEQGPLEEE